jgi:lipoate-protein ligase A
VISGAGRLPAPDWPVLPPLPLSAVEHLALDEVLLDAVAAGQRGPCVRFWRWTEKALVLGSHQSVRNEVDPAAAAELGFAVVRRISGGGTMVCEPAGTLTYSMYLPDSFVSGLSFVGSFRALDAWVVAALVELGVPASYRPINDIVSPSGKIAGAAQARRRGAVLHHTTMAFATDPAIVPRLIRIGRPTLEVRGPRSAEKVVTPLSMFTSLGLEEVEAVLLGAAGGPSGTVTETELAAARHLAEAKYATPEWVHRFP